MLLYFLRDSLPWQNLFTKDRVAEQELMLERKMTIGVDELCKGPPKGFKLYFEHVRSLKLNQTPKYSYLRKIFRNLFVREGFDFDLVFDWTNLKY